MKNVKKKRCNIGHNVQLYIRKLKYRQCLFCFVLFFVNRIHLRPCRGDWLVTCLPLQSTASGSLGDIVSSPRNILLNCIIFPDY